MEEEPTEEEPSEDIRKTKIMRTKDGRKVKVIDDKNQPKQIKIDKKTGKRIPRKKKIINSDGEVEDVEEIVESDVQTEYDEETGKRRTFRRN